MLTEFIELSRKVKEQIKATQKEIKENIQGTNNEGKKTGSQNNMEQTEEINIQLEQNEETRMQKKKNVEKLRNLWDNFKIPTSELWGCWKEKKKSKILKIYLNK